MNHSIFLCELIRGCGYKSYLELGVYIGETLAPISSIVNRHVGVDTIQHNLIAPLNMFYGTTDEFFKQNFENFDCIFIDANHNAKSVEQDLRNALGCLSVGGMIILHDTNPNHADLFAEGYCSDSYKIHECLDDMLGKRLNYITIPFLAPGLTLINIPGHERYLKLLGASR